MCTKIDKQMNTSLLLLATFFTLSTVQREAVITTVFTSIGADTTMEITTEIKVITHTTFVWATGTNEDGVLFTAPSAYTQSFE